MAQINVSNLTFNYEGSFDNIFENVSFCIDTNWKLGFIGRNGKGKTTFLNLLMGKYEYSGCIKTNAVFDYFPYKYSPDTNLSASDLMEEWKAGVELWRVLIEMDELQIDAAKLYEPYAQLSFGEKTKIMLAVLFSGDNDFLLIDEPTNHLDVEARNLVKKYLASKRGFILVSHDADLLDSCIDHVLVLNRKSIDIQSGNFSMWWENKEKADEHARRENEKHSKEISKLKQAADRTSRWADKSENSKIGFDPIKEHDRQLNTRSYIGAKTKKMQSQVKAFEGRMDRAIQEKEGLLNDIEQTRNLKINPLKHYRDRLVYAKEYSLRYKDGDSDVISNLTFEINQGERVFISGQNGCGKSSLIKAIMGNNDNMIEGGILETASNLKISYINQDTSHLKGSLREYAFDNQLDYSMFLALLSHLDFDKVQFEKNIEDFSEGQKKKVLLAGSLMTSAHLYIWDEPLNYIDVFSRMQIEKLIEDFKPTMLIVEHDVRFKEKLATRVIEL
ncbi:MAG: ABC-F type ribosomal protection protein [Saccharofermentans sp.]|nr:ABC-F type ribosomal protection protein [Saccharofermentans sp.]